MPRIRSRRLLRMRRPSRLGTAASTRGVAAGFVAFFSLLDRSCWQRAWTKWRGRRLARNVDRVCGAAIRLVRAEKKTRTARAPSPLMAALIRRGVIVGNGRITGDAR